METRQNENVLTFTETFPVTAEQLFSMFENPNVQHWWGPALWPVKLSEQDFTTGGTWFYCMVGPDGEKACGKSVYETVSFPDKIVMRDYFADEDGNIDTSLPAGLSTITFEEKDGSTTLTMLTEYDSVSDADKVVEMEMLEGVTVTSSRCR